MSTPEQQDSNETLNAAQLLESVRPALHNHPDLTSELDGLVTELTQATQSTDELAVKLAAFLERVENEMDNTSEASSHAIATLRQNVARLRAEDAEARLLSVLGSKTR